MAEERIDNNSRNIWGAYNETTGTIENIRVDSVMGYLEVFGVPYEGGTFTTINRAKIDGNGRNTLSAYNEILGGAEALRCGSGGELIIISV